MHIRVWGARGSLPTPGAEMVRYGGNTSCVQVTGPRADHVIVLDAGSGIRELGAALPRTVARVDVLLTHLHLARSRSRTKRRLTSSNVVIVATDRRNVWGQAVQKDPRRAASAAPCRRPAS